MRILKAFSISKNRKHLKVSLERIEGLKILNPRGKDSNSEDFECIFLECDYNCSSLCVRELLRISDTEKPFAIFRSLILKRKKYEEVCFIFTRRV